MAVEREIINYLSTHGRATTTDIANATGYSTGYIRQKAKELLKDGTINGTKAKRIPAYIINGRFVVMTGDRDQLLEIVKDHAPGRYSTAASMSTRELQRFIRNHIADQVVGGPWIWEFWV